MHGEVRKPAATKLGQQPRKLQRPPCERLCGERRRWRHTHIQLGGRVLFVALCVPFERQSHVPARKPRDACVKVPLAAPARGFCSACQEPAVLSEPARKVIRAPDIGPPVHAIGQDVHAVLLAESRKQRNIVLHLRKLLGVLRTLCAGRSTYTCCWCTDTCRKQRNIVLHLRKLLCALRALCAGRSTDTCRWSTETCRWRAGTCCWCTRTCCWCTGTCRWSTETCRWSTETCRWSTETCHRSTGTCCWCTRTCCWSTETCRWCAGTCCWYRQAHWVRRHVVCFLPTNAANAFVWRL